mgnify:CR=1 FL=1|jgi:hypothetical protein
MEKKNNVFALIISLALIIGMVIPVTLAVSTAQDSSVAEFSVNNETATPVTEETPEAESDAAPAPEELGECICEPKPAEGEAHAEGCPLYAAQAAELSLFEKLMACETLEEIYTILDETPEEKLMQLSEEEIAQIEAKIAVLEPEPLPAIEEDSDETVASEIVYPTVNFSWVAPFGPPVGG